MNVRALWKKSPKWFIAIAIVAVSTIMFAVWWFGRKSEERQIAEQKVEAAEAKRDEVIVADVEIDPKTMFVSGKRVYQLKGSEIVEVAGIRFDFGGELSANAIVAYDGERFLVAENARYFAYHKNGRSIGQLTLSDGSRFDGHSSNDLDSAVFAKNGDIWGAEIDWGKAVLINERKVTDTGLFTLSPFTKALHAATEKALIYSDIRAGRMHVDLLTGKVEPVEMPVNCVTSPDGKLLIGDVAGRPHQFVVLDIDTQQLNQFPIPMRVNPGGFAWLNNEQSAYAIGADIYLYRHKHGDFEILFRGINRSQQIQLSTPSYGNEYIVANEPGTAATAIKVDTEESFPLPEITATAFEWISQNAMLLISDVTDSESRGTWFYRIGSGEEPKKLFGKPLYGSVGGNRQPHPKFYFPGENLMIIRNLDGWVMINTINGQTAPVNLDLGRPFEIREL